MRRKSKLQMDVSSKTGVFLNDVVNLIDPSVIIRLLSLLALVGFAFPFATVSCANASSFSLNGFDMMIGKRISFVSDSLYITPQPLIILLAVACVLSVVASVMKPGSFVVLLGKISSFAAIGISAAQILSFDFMANTYKKSFFGNVVMDLNVSRGPALFYIPLIHALCLIFIFKQKNILTRINTLSKEPSVYDSIMDEIDSGGGSVSAAKAVVQEEAQLYATEIVKPDVIKPSENSVPDSVVKPMVVPIAAVPSPVNANVSYTPANEDSKPSEAAEKTARIGFATQKSAGKIIQKNNDEQKVEAETLAVPEEKSISSDFLVQSMAVPRTDSRDSVSSQTDSELQVETVPTAGLAEAELQAAPLPSVVPSSAGKFNGSVSSVKNFKVEAVPPEDSLVSGEAASAPEQVDEVLDGSTDTPVVNENQEEIAAFVSGFKLENPADDLKVSNDAVDGGWVPPTFSDTELSSSQLAMDGGFVVASVGDSYKKEAAKFSASEEADLPSHIKEINGVSDRYKKEMQQLLCVAEAETAAAYKEALSITDGAREIDEGSEDSVADMNYLVEEALPQGSAALSSAEEEPVNEMIFDPVNNQLVCAEEDTEHQIFAHKEAVSSGVSAGISFISSAQSSDVADVSDSLDSGSVGAAHSPVAAKLSADSSRSSQRHRINFITDMDSGDVEDKQGVSNSTSIDSVGGNIAEDVVSDAPKHNFSFISQNNDLSECIKNAKMNFAKKLSSDIKNAGDKDS